MTNFSKNMVNKAVNQMYARESTFTHHSRTNEDVSFISDIGFLKASVSFNTETCIYELINKKSSIAKYDLKSDVLGSKCLLPELRDIVFNTLDIKDEKMVSMIEGIKVDTNILIVNSMDLHVWENLYNDKYSDLNVVFLKSRNQVRQYTKNNFEKANSTDMLVVTSKVWSSILTDNGYRGYNSDVIFRFNRVIFSVRDSGDIDVNFDNRLHMPLANFTWIQQFDTSFNFTSSSQEDHDLWSSFLPVYCIHRDEDLPWDREWSKEFSDALTIEGIVNYGGRAMIGELNIERYDKGITTSNVGDYIQTRLSKDPSRRFLLVGDSFRGRSNKLLSKSLRKNGISYKSVNQTGRLNRRKAKASGVSVIIVKSIDYYRKDLNLDFIDELIIITTEVSSAKVRLFIEKLTPMDAEDNHLDVTFVNKSSTRISNILLKREMCKMNIQSKVHNVCKKPRVY